MDISYAAGSMRLIKSRRSMLVPGGTDMSNSPINLMKQAMSTLLAQSTVAGQPDTKPADKLPSQTHDNVSILGQNNILLPPQYSTFSKSELQELKQHRTGLFLDYKVLGSIEQKLSQSFNIAFISLVLGEGSIYQTWKTQAIENASMLPGGAELAVPVTKGDLFAIEGKYEEAVQEYEKAVDTLTFLKGKGEDVSLEIAAIHGRMKQVLFTDAYGVLNRSRGHFDIPARDKAIEKLKKIYQIEPSEVHLAAIFTAYAKSGLDLYNLIGRIEGNEKVVEEHHGRMWNRFIQTGNVSYIENDFGIHAADPSVPDADFFREMGLDFNASSAQLENDLYRPMFDEAVQGIKSLIETTLKDDPQEMYLQLADFHAHIGDTDKIRRNLFFAHSSFSNLSPDQVDEVRLAKDITCLHRLFTLQLRDYGNKSKILGEAKAEIIQLKKYGDTEQTSLLMLENAYLGANLTEDLALQRFEGKLTTQEEFQAEVKGGYRKAIQLAKSNIAKIKDPETKARYVQMMLDVRVTLFEKELSESTLLRLQDEDEKAMKAETQAKISLDNEFKMHGPSLDRSVMQELQGQADYSYAYFLFRKGEISSSILQVMSIAQNSPNSGAAKMIYDDRSWVRKYGITTASGGFSADVGKTSHTAALKEIAGQLDEEQGRALAACGLAALGYIALDLAFGEKISGASVATACVVGYAIDRSFVVGENWQRISDAYSSGISTVDSEEALTNAGLFLFDMSTIFVGGLAGRMTQEVILKGGNLLKGRALKWFIKRGALSGPWKRPVTGFFLKEASFVGNAYVFNKTSKYLQGKIRGETPGKQKEQNELLTSWLFVRFLPIFHAKRWNLGDTLIKGTARLDMAAKFLINTGAAATAIQGALTVTTDQDGKYMDRVARTFRDLVFLHLGSKGFETIINSKTLSRFGLSLEKSKSDLKSDLELKYAETKKTGKANPHERVDWFLKRATEEAVHTADVTKGTLQFFKQLGYDIFVRPVKGPKDVVSKRAKPKGELPVEAVAPEGASAKRGLARWVDVIRTEYRRLKSENWEKLPENPDAKAKQAYLDAAKENIPPWRRRGLYADEAVEAAGQRLQVKPKEGERAPDTTIFKEAGKAGEEAPTTFRGRLQKYLAKEDPLFNPENGAKLPFSKRFKRNVHTLNFILSYPLRAAGAYVLKTSGKVGEANPRIATTRRVKMATKEVQREVVREYIEDSPPMLSTLWKAIRGPGESPVWMQKIGKKITTIRNSDGWNTTKRILGKAYGDYFMPVFELAHVAGMYYSTTDFLAIDNDEDQEGLFDMDIDTLPGAAGFVMGSNYMVGKLMGITTLSGGLIAEVFKTMTWGMLVSMEGSDPFKYFTKKPSEIVWLHIEYFWVLMGQVALFSGMHAKSGNPIYKALTNMPVARAAVPSLTRFHKYYTARSTFFKPDFVKGGRLLSLAAVGPFHMAIAFVTKGKDYLDTHDYLMFHRLLKTIHLGIWLKPLVAKFNQAGTLGQFLERFTGMAADWIDGLLTPIKLGKGTYKGRLEDSNLSVEDVTEASAKLEAMAKTNHVVFRKATTSLDVAGPLGAMVQDEAGYPAQSIWRTGWRVEVEGVAKHLEIMADGIKSYPIIAINDAMSMDFAIASFGKSIGKKKSIGNEIAMFARSMEIKMLANQAKGNPAYRPYYDLVYKNTDGEKQAYWDSIPDATNKEGLLINIGRLNDGDYDVDEIVGSLLK